MVYEPTTQKLTLSNDGVHDLTGYSSAEIQALSLGDFFAEGSIDIVEALIEIASQNPVDLSENELWIKRKSGRRCPVRLAVKSLYQEGRISLIMNLIDLSEERKQSLERQKLIQESARVSKLADIGQLAAGMAHELNNPLAIMSGYLEEIESQLKEPQIEISALAENFEPVHNAAKRMKKIVSSMLAKVRNDSQTRAVVSLKKIVDETLIFLEQMLKTQSIELETKLDPVPIFCDQVQIDQIVTNIISNACNALDGKATPRIRVATEVRNGKVQLSIWNNGDPIPESVQEKLFTPFFTTKAVGEGTGLGLYMGYQIMKAHQGELSFESAEGKGTTFFLTFPESEFASNPEEKADSLRALVIEDDVFFRKLVCKKLEKLNIRCVDCRDIFEAEIAIKRETKAFDFIFVDYNLPKEKGTGFVKKLVAPHKEAKLILMSGALHRAELESTSMDSGFHAFLPKPIVKAELEAILARLKPALQKKVG